MDMNQLKFDLTLFMLYFSVLLQVCGGKPVGTSYIDMNQLKFDLTLYVVFLCVIADMWG